MKQLLIIICLCTGMFLSTSLSAQDFFGAQNTGKHTVGINFKYDGDFWLGAHYNLRRFPVFMLKSNFDVNIIGEIKIDDGFAGAGAELGFGQVVADGKDFKAGFGLGLRTGIRYEYCAPDKIEGDDMEVSMSDGCSRLSAKFEVKPGGYGLQYAAGATIKTDVAAFYFKCKNVGYKREIDASKIEFRYFDKLVVGMQADYTTAKFLGSGTQYHVTADVEHTFYLGVKHQKAWNTWTLKGDYPKISEEEMANEGSCVMPKSNLDFKMSHSMRF